MVAQRQSITWLEHTQLGNNVLEVEASGCAVAKNKVIRPRDSWRCQDVQHYVRWIILCYMMVLLEACVCFCVCVCEVGDNGRFDFLFFLRKLHVMWFGKSETTQLLRVCVYSMWVTVREGKARQSRVVFRECIGTDSTDIKVGVCFFLPQRKLFIHSCLWIWLVVIMSHWSRPKQADEEGTACLLSF